MAAEKLLSEASCKSAKAQSSIYYLNDGAGLRLRIRPDGSRTWIYRYRLDGKEMSTGLGAYPKVGLQIARSKAQEWLFEKSRRKKTAKCLAVFENHFVLILLGMDKRSYLNLRGRNPRFP